MQRVRYSQNCTDLGTRWNPSVSKCVPCDFKPGHRVSPNCGYDDEGGKHELYFQPCPNNTFNDGSSASCHPCTVCPPGFSPLAPCTSTTDTRCTTTPSPKNDTGRSDPTPTTTSPPQTFPNVLLAVQLVVLCLVLFAVCLVCVRRKRALSVGKGLFGRKRLRTTEAGFEVNGTEEDTLDSAIVSAPIQTVLNDLDVLEDLMILLDPETQGVKNTKHLASHCGFSSAWITYAYSMRDCKSPLKAVLEGITSRQPDWTVGDLVKMLRLMERNDAISMLSRLRPDGTNVCNV
ncbi:IGF-like family receptor 1 [Takifugu rubripes]|uniref:IGF-like family receptor 1 n=1 Tax=Takifugu rubripes TaxID=31033 RepID=A0A674N640_TAKRU|nr:IGF-like family receptor 1 [Takifugu rubripes]|eukprot:XP_011603900.1 PREDICTED: IGF-like family receptor 1 [Takifugu rubripes]